MAIPINKIIEIALNKMAFLDGVSFIQGVYAPQMKIPGVDSNMQSVEYGEPMLEFDTLSMEGSPIHMFFKIDGEQVKLEYKLNVKTNVEGALPMALTDLNLGLTFPDSRKSISLDTILVPGQRPQVVRGTTTWKNVYDFIAVKKAILTGPIILKWSGKVQWVDITSPEMQENIKKEDYRPEPKIASVSGEIPISISSNTDDCSYKGMFEGVKNLLCWEYEIIDGERVFFKDPFKDDAIYFLPQEYRIKALESNAPDLTTEIVKEGDSQKILTRIRIAPYVHPNAKRDAYKIFRARKGKDYCDLRYGGFDSARFEWGGEMPNGKLYGNNGFTDININNNEIDADPSSCFPIVLETPKDGIVKLFQEKIAGEGIHIGNVYFTVHEDIDNENVRELGPIPVKLDLHKLAGIQPEVRINNCTWPDYEATITNRGSYPIEIGDLTMSVLQWKDNKVHDAAHNLQNQSSLPLPVTLARDASVTLRLTQDQAEKLKHRKLAGIGKVDENYWNELLCEPYSIRLHDEDIQEIMTKTNESAAYKLEDWILSLDTAIEWSNHPDIGALQVGLRNKFGLNEIVTLTGPEDKPKISMTPNLNASLQTQQAGDQMFEYRLRRILKDGPKDPEWTAWYTCSGNYLLLREEDLNEPTVPNESELSAPVADNEPQLGTEQPKPETETEPEAESVMKDLIVSFWMSWNKDIKEVIVDVLYDDDKNNLHFTKPNIRLNRDNKETPTVTLQVKNTEIKPQIIVRYQGKKPAMSDLTTITDLMVKLPSAAPPFTGESTRLTAAISRLDNFETPQMQFAALKSKKKKQIGLTSIAALCVLSLLGFLFNQNGCDRNSNSGPKVNTTVTTSNTSSGSNTADDVTTKKVNTTVTTSNASSGSTTTSAVTTNNKNAEAELEDLILSFKMTKWDYKWIRVTVAVSYDDDKNNVHAANKVIFTKEKPQVQKVKFHVKKSGVRPRVQVGYKYKSGELKESEELTVLSSTVDLPGAFPPKGENINKRTHPIKKRLERIPRTRDIKRGTP